MSEADSTRRAAERQGSYHHGNLRASLLQAAEAELEEKGIEAISLRSIAKRAGVSHAAPSHHFGDVNGLLTALAAIGFERFLAALTSRADATGPDMQERLKAAMLGYVDFAVANPALFRLIFSSKRPDFENPALADAADKAFDFLIASVREAGGRDPKQEWDAMGDVAAIWATCHGLADLLQSGRLKPVAALPDAERERTIASIFARALPKTLRRC